MVRPMFLQFPLDPVCATPQVEGQFMLGPSWLVAPVTQYQAANWTAYLPAIPANETWVYWFNQSATYAGGQWVTLPTPIDEFPLFARVPVTPPPPPAYANATFLWSEERLDAVLCVGASCYEDNVPSNPGAYVTQSIEGVGVAASADASITIDGQSYPLLPLNLCFSYVHNDNYVATNASCPDASYSVSFTNGWVLGAPAPGSLPLQVWLRAYNATKLDYASVASGAGLAWAQAHGYAYQFTTGYLLAATPPL